MGGVRGWEKREGGEDRAEAGFPLLEAQREYETTAKKVTTCTATATSPFGGGVELVSRVAVQGVVGQGADATLIPPRYCRGALTKQLVGG